MGRGPQPAGHAPLTLTPDPGLAADLYKAAHLTGSFVLRSGQTSGEYFDKYRFESDPKLLKRLAARMAALIPPDTEVLAGIELGGVPLATAISLQTGLPAVFVRKARKTYGTCLAVEGGDITGRRICAIEDVISTGGAVVDAALFIREAGGLLSSVVCAVWRGPLPASISDLPGLPVAAAFLQSELNP